MSIGLPGARPPLDGSPPRAWNNEEDLSAAATASASHMDRALLHGLAWTAGAKWASQLLSWASTLVVANVLDPADYGIVGMSVLVLTLVSLVNEFGVTTAIVTLRDLTEEDLRRLNAFAVLFGLVCFAVGAALAIPIGAYFRSPVLPLVVLVQSTGFILSSLQSVPSARLQREVDFKRLATIDVVRSFVASLAALSLALIGARYWTLVGAELLAAATQTVLLVRVRPTGFLWHNFDRVRSAIAFGGRTVIGRLSWYVYSNADFAVAGRMLGATALGAYSFAWTLVSLPVEKITSLLARVTPSILSANRDNPAGLQRYVLGITEGLALLTVPATAGIALVAPDLIPLAFGQKWQMAVVPLQFLAASMAIRSIVPVTTNAMVALRDVRFLMWHGVVTAGIFPICFLTGARVAGIQGIAFAWLIAYPLSVIPLFWRALYTRIFDARGYLAALAPAVECTAVMCAVVLALRWRLITLSTPPSLAVRCAAEVAAGVVTYLLVLRIRYYSRARAAIAFIRPNTGTVASVTG